MSVAVSVEGCNASGGSRSGADLCSRRDRLLAGAGGLAPRLLPRLRGWRCPRACQAPRCRGGGRCCAVRRCVVVRPHAFLTPEPRQSCLSPAVTLSKGAHGNPVESRLAL